MKVCFISHSSAKGGAERALLELLDALQRRDVECFLILPSYGPFVDELKERRIVFKVFYYKQWVGKNTPLWKRLVRNILNFFWVILIALKIKQWKCDIVYTNTITINVGAFAAKLLRLPHIWHIHEFGYEDHGLTFDLGKKFSLWLMDCLSVMFVVNSYAVAQKYQQYFKSSKLRVVYQSVTVPEDIITKNFVAKTNIRIRCAIVGYLQEGKRQEDAIRAIGKLSQERIKAELLIVGDGDPKYRAYLYNLVKEMKLDSIIKFIGYVDNPFPLMQTADVLLMCSRYEAFGRVTVEAMKIGKPVIGARSGGTTELIRDGFNGFLYTLGNYEELAEKIKYLYKHPDIRLQMSFNAFKWANERFTQDRYGENIMNILKMIVNS